MATVWIVNEAGHDYRDAERFGELKPLTIGNINPLEVDRLNYHLTRGIAKYADKDDYILISGTPMANAAALLIWLLRFGEAKILQWNGKRRLYELKTLTVDQIEELIEKEMVR